MPPPRVSGGSASTRTRYRGLIGSGTGDRKVGRIYGFCSCVPQAACYAERKRSLLAMGMDRLSKRGPCWVFFRGIPPAYGAAPPMDTDLSREVYDRFLDFLYSTLLLYFSERV